MRSRLFVLAAVVVLAACDSSVSAPTTSISPESTTTSLTIPDRVEVPTTVDPGAADAGTIERVAVAVRELAAEVEVLRGLIFVVEPDVVVLQPEVFENRLRTYYESVIATSGPVGKTGLYRLAGLLPFDSTESILARLEPPPTAAFYDMGRRQLVVTGDLDDADPFQRASLVHELVLALVDQHHSTATTRSELVAVGADDRLRAFDALVEGDATYFQLVHIQNLPSEEQAAIAAEFAATDAPVVGGIPDFIRSSLAFPYDAGTTFVADLVASAGIAAVDQAYRIPPESSEHILHPERYRRGETAAAVAPLEVSVAGATTAPSATFGELQLDQLLSLSLDSGLVTQTVDGWRGDQYQLIETDDTFAFALSLAMQSNTDAIEVVTGLIAHARDVLQAGDGVEAAGGLLWDDGDYYVFLDRVGDGLMYVLANDRDLGRAVRSQVEAP
jgi:hypothetical protein